MSETDAIKQAGMVIDAERRRHYLDAGGGVCMPVAGAIYWLALGAAGLVLPLRLWCLLAFATSGLIFPLGLLLQGLTRSKSTAKSAFGSLLFAALFAMLGFWAVTIPLFYGATEFVPLSLAIGMSLHWPAIGWTFGRTFLFSSHLAVRTAGALAIWYWFPLQHTTLLPVWVATVYAVTALAITIDVSWLRRRS